MKRFYLFDGFPALIEGGLPKIFSNGEWKVLYETKKFMENADIATKEEFDEAMKKKS